MLRMWPTWAAMDAASVCSRWFSAPRFSPSCQVAGQLLPRASLSGNSELVTLLVQQSQRSARTFPARIPQLRTCNKDAETPDCSERYQRCATSGGNFRHAGIPRGVAQLRLQIAGASSTRVSRPRTRRECARVCPGRRRNRACASDGTLHPRGSLHETECTHIALLGHRRDNRVERDRAGRGMRHFHDGIRLFLGIDTGGARLTDRSRSTASCAW
jgi:hypothetical protein